MIHRRINSDRRRKYLKENTDIDVNIQLFSVKLDQLLFATLKHIIQHKTAPLFLVLVAMQSDALKIEI